MVQTASQPLVGASWSKIATTMIRLKTGLGTIIDGGNTGDRGFKMTEEVMKFPPAPPIKFR